MLNDLPTFIDPLHLAKQGTSLRGSLAVAHMSRLHHTLCEVQGEVSIDWRFAHTEPHWPTITGSIQTQLHMLCQRCLHPMEWPVDAKIALVVLPHGHSEEDLPEGFEVLTLTGNPIPLLTLVEDELILALPIVIRHSTCSFNEYQVTDTVAQDPVESYHPFQVLSQWKKQNTK